jgi:chromosome segregation ATPase
MSAVCALCLQLAESQACVQQLQEQMAAAQEQAQQLEERSAVLAAERDAAARNLLRAETELNDVGEYSTKMFRQVSIKGYSYCGLCLLLQKVGAHSRV